MLPPLPRCSGWAYSSLISPRRVTLPRKGGRAGLHLVLFEACSAFTRVAACTLALSPIRDTLIEGFSHFVTSMTAPIASGWSGCRVGFTPTGKRRLVTAHTQSRPWTFGRIFGLDDRESYRELRLELLCCRHRLSRGTAPHEREYPRRKDRFRAARSGDRTHRATDGHLGSAARRCKLAARLAAHLRRHPRQRHTSLSSGHRQLTSLRGKRPSSRGDARGPPFGLSTR